MDQGNKQAGNLYEQEFALRCLRQNLFPFLPTGDFLPVDCVVLNPAGKSYRVQVKGTDCRQYDVRHDPNGQKYRYKVVLSRVHPADFDILVVYIATEDVFYIIPAAYATSSCVAVRPHLKSKSKWEQWRERWDLFMV